ncbi:MAG: hypothetical protein ACOYN0_13145 [Phycisphaerales bacterium]
MAALAKREKLPGHRDTGTDSFSSDLFGAPFDFELLAAVSPGPDGKGSLVRFAAKLKPKTPVIFWALTAFTIWPGEWMTDSMIRTYWPSYGINTWYWYLPLLVLPMPYFWFRMMKKSRLAAADHAQEVLGRVSNEIAGKLEQPGQG